MTTFTLNLPVGSPIPICGWSHGYRVDLVLASPHFVRWILFTFVGCTFPFHIHWLVGYSPLPDALDDLVCGITTLHISTAVAFIFTLRSRLVILAPPVPFYVVHLAPVTWHYTHLLPVDSLRFWLLAVDYRCYVAPVTLPTRSLPVTPRLRLIYTLPRRCFVIYRVG